MGRLVFVECSCLLDTWTMATRLVRSVRGPGRPDGVGVLEAEAARGTDLVSVHRALWGLLAGYDYRALTGLSAGACCTDRADVLGRAATRALRWHRRAGDTIVVVSDLMPLFIPPITEHLRVDLVLCGSPPVNQDGRLAPGYPDLLLGIAAAQAAEREARREGVPLADCVAYGRDPRDRELLDAVGHPVRIGYDGELRSPEQARTCEVLTRDSQDEPGRARHDDSHPAA